MFLASHILSFQPSHERHQHLEGKMSYDLQAIIHQTMADKVVESVSYPLVAFEHRKPFSGFSVLNSLSAPFEDEFSIDSKSFLSDMVNNLKLPYSRRSTPEQGIEDLSGETLQDLNDMLDNYKDCLEAFERLEVHNKKNPSQSLKWDGPTKAELQSIIRGLTQFTIQEVSRSSFSTLSKLIDIKVQVTWIRVMLGEKPKFKLSGNKFDLSLPSIMPSGTGEVWAKYKWIKCVKKKYKLCYKWKIVTKTKRILKVTLKDIKLKIQSGAELRTEGSLVKVFANVKKLRLAYKYFDKIPLEKLANKILSKKPVKLFDASAFVATMPVLDSSFRVSKISLPSVSGKVVVQIDVA